MIMRWEIETRWYEAYFVYDLLGQWTVVRTWGGKGSRRHGQMIDVVESPAAGFTRIETLNKQARDRRNGPAETGFLVR